LSWQESEQVLASQPNRFLVRLHAPEDYWLSYSTASGNVLQKSVSRFSSGNGAMYSLQGSSKKFKTIAGLIAHFKQNPVDKSKNLLVIPCERRQSHMEEAAC